MGFFSALGDMAKAVGNYAKNNWEDLAITGVAGVVSVVGTPVLGVAVGAALGAAKSHFQDGAGWKGTLAGAAMGGMGGIGAGAASGGIKGLFLGGGALEDAVGKGALKTVLTGFGKKEGADVLRKDAAKAIAKKMAAKAGESDWTKFESRAESKLAFAKGGFSGRLAEGMGAGDLTVPKFYRGLAAASVGTVGLNAAVGTTLESLSGGGTTNPVRIGTIKVKDISSPEMRKYQDAPDTATVA